MGKETKKVLITLGSILSIMLIIGIFIPKNGNQQSAWSKRYDDSIKRISDSTLYVMDSIRKDSIKKASIHKTKQQAKAKNNKPKEASVKVSVPYNSSGTSVQCRGTTKSGNRCSRKTTSSNGYCYQHGG